jgi:hypothetical protein
MTTAEKENASTDSNVIIEDITLGVWKLKIAKASSNNLVQDIKSAVPLLHRLCSDIFTMAPGLFIFFAFCQIWQGVGDAMLMHFSSALLRQVCHGCLYSLRGLSINPTCGV